MAVLWFLGRYLCVTLMKFLNFMASFIFSHAYRLTLAMASIFLTYCIAMFAA